MPSDGLLTEHLRLMREEQVYQRSQMDKVLDIVNNIRLDVAKTGGRQEVAITKSSVRVNVMWAIFGAVGVSLLAWFMSRFLPAAVSP